MKESTKTTIFELLRNEPEYEHVQLSQAQVDEAHFKLNFVELDFMADPPVAPPH